MIRQEEQEIAALEMLLDAEWQGNHFLRVDRGVTVAGIPWHWRTYYNRQGEEIKRNDIVNGDNETRP
jgi:hypothetical protein